MKAENLFRFVAVRSPAPIIEKPVLPGMTVPPGNGFVTAVRAQADSGAPLEDTRRRVAGEFMDSSAYLSRNTAWAPFLATEGQARRAVAEPGPDLGATLERLLEAVLGGPTDVETFVRSEGFGDLREALWSSFLSTAVLPRRRPQDADRLVFWLRFLWLCERLAGGGAQQTLLEEFDKRLPSVPNVLTRTSPAAAPPAPQPDERLVERRRQFAAATAHLDEVRTAHTHLSELVAARLDSPRQPEENSPNGGVVAGDGDLMLRPEEISPPVLATLRRLGLAVSRVDALDLVSELEVQLGTAHAAVSSLRRLDEVALTGSALVRRRRVLSTEELTR